MTEVSFSTYQGAEVVQAKVYIEDAGVSGVRASEYVDFTDRFGETNGKNLLLSLSRIAQNTEARQGVSFTSSISQLTWFNGDDRFWSSPFPLGTGSIYGRNRPTTFETVNGNTAYFRVSKGGTRSILVGRKLKVAARVRLLTGNEIETDIAIFLIESITQSTQKQQIQMKVTAIAQPLLTNTAEVIKDGNGWYTNRNPAFLVRKILEDQYKVPDYNVGDSAAGGLPSTFQVPDRILVSTDDWITEKQWVRENPSGTFSGADSRVLSNYGRPPEWDGTRYRDDGLTTRAVALWQKNDGTCSVVMSSPNRLTFSGASTLTPTGKMGPRIGDAIELRDTTDGINDGTYTITAVTSSYVDVTPALSQADSGMAYTITVLFLGCDDQLWEYIPGRELYRRLTSDGSTNIELGDVTNGDGDTHSLDFRLLELNSNEVLVWSAWDLPRYKEDDNPANWGFDLTSQLKAGIFWRNNSEGDTYYESSTVSDVHNGQLIWRTLQYQWFHPSDGDQFTTYPHTNRQAGAQLNLSDPAYSSVSEYSTIADWNYTGSNHAPITPVTTAAPGAWLANRGMGVILPFAQKLWVATKDRWGNSADTDVINSYSYIFANKRPRQTAWPGFYFNYKVPEAGGDSYNLSYFNVPTYTQLYSGADDTALARTDFTYPNFRRSERSLENYTFSAKELTTHRDVDGAGEFAGSVVSWWAAENTNSDGLTSWDSVDRQELVICKRQDRDINEVRKTYSQLKDAYFVYEDNRVADAGVWTIQTPVIVRDRNYVDDDWDDGTSGSLVIPHSWGTRGSICFVESSSFTNGLIAFAAQVTASGGGGVYWRYLGLNASSVGTVTTVSTSLYGSALVQDDVVPPSETSGSSSAASFAGWHPAGNTGQIRALNQPFILSTTSDSDGYLYAIYLWYGLETAAYYGHDYQSIDASDGYALPHTYVVKIDLDANPTNATLATIYDGRNDQQIEADNYYIPIDILDNPDGGSSRNLQLVLMNANRLDTGVAYRLGLMSKTDSSHNNQGLDALVIGKGFRNRPFALTYDTVHDFWYAVTGENGGLVSWPVIGATAYNFKRLDFGFPAVRDEGYVNVNKLAIDTHTRRAPDPATGATEITLVNLSGNNGTWTDHSGTWNEYLLGVLLGSPLTWRACFSWGSAAQTTFAGAEMSSVTGEYELKAKFALADEITPSFPHVSSFEVETDELVDEGWQAIIGSADSDAWELFDTGTALLGRVLKGTSNDTSDTNVIALVPQAGGLKYNGTTGAFSLTNVTITRFEITEAHDNEVNLFLFTDHDTSSLTGNRVGFRLSRATPTSQWALYRVVKTDAVNTETLVHSFTGGAGEFITTGFSAQITRSGDTYNFYINGGSSLDTFSLPSAPDGGTIAIGVEGCTATITQVNLDGATRDPMGGVVISDGNTSSQKAVVYRPGEDRLELRSGSTLSTVSATFSTDELGVMGNASGLPWPPYGKYIELTIRKNFHGDGWVNVYLDAYSTEIPIFGYEDNGTGSNDWGYYVKDSVIMIDRTTVSGTGANSSYDPNNRAVIWGVSAPSFSREFALGDEVRSGKFFLWKYDVYYSSRIELADFSGMTQWKALQELARVTNHVMGFELDDFFFVPRELAPSAEEVLFKTAEAGENPNIISISDDDGSKEIYNRVTITPGNTVLQQPSWKINYTDRNEAELKRLEFEAVVDHRGVRQESIRLKCIRPGRLTPKSGVNSTPSFAYLIQGREFETFLVDRKNNNSAPHQIRVAESVAGLVSGDIVEVSVLSGGEEEPTTIYGVVDSAADSETGGLITLQGAFSEDEDFPSSGLAVGTTVTVRTDSKWSHLVDTTGVPRFWPHDEDNPDNDQVALESGVFYRIGTSSVYMRLIDPFYETQVKEWERFVDEPSGTYLDEKEAYVLGTKEMGDFREGDIIEIEAPGLKIESGELFSQSRVSSTSQAEYGKRQYPVSNLKFLTPRQARDLARRIIRQSAFPRGIYTVVIPYNPSVGFLDSTGRLRRYTVMDPDLFPYSAGFSRTGIPRSISHDPIKHQTILVLKDENDS